MLRRNAALATSAPSQILEPPLARFLFADTHMALLWLLVRLYAGYQWLVAGLEKLTGTDYEVTSKGFGKPPGTGV
jgi:thiosulfate dehydrogenase [quinone] large subunit